MFSDKTGPDLEGSWSEERLWLEVGEPLHGPEGVTGIFLENHLQELLKHLLSHLPVGSGLANEIARCPISMVYVLNLMISFCVPW